MAKTAFNSIGALKPHFSNFSVSNNKKYTTDFGLLQPCYWLECLPGDRIKYGVESVVRLAPTVAPVMHKMSIRYEAFFVPFRIIWENWEDFITGGKSGNKAPEMPVWDFAFKHRTSSQESYNTLTFHAGLSSFYGYDYGYNSLWDAFSMPVVKFGHKSDLDAYLSASGKTISEVLPYALPKYAYNKVWYDFYRDQNCSTFYYDYSGAMQEEFSDAQFVENFVQNNEFVKSRLWTKNNYFTSALPFIQRGTAPALSFDLDGLDVSNVVANGPITFSEPESVSEEDVSTSQPNLSNLGWASSYNYYTTPNSHSDHDMLSVNSTPVAGLKDKKLGVFTADSVNGRSGEYDHNMTFYNAKSNVSVSSSIDSSGVNFALNASDIRWLMQTQKFLERNARAGARYNEQVMAHFSVATGDSRVDRPEFLGSTKAPIIVSEVPQTSESTSSSKQGNLAGRGLGAVSSQFVKYRCKEHGIFLVLASVVPQLSFASQGIGKEWIKPTRYNFAFPEFAHLSEQPIKQSELFFDYKFRADSDDNYYNDKVFGYTGIYNEYRKKQDELSGLLRTDLSYWHLNYQLPDYNADGYNMTDIKVSESLLSIYQVPIFSTSSELVLPNLNRIFAAPTEPGFQVYQQNYCFVSRPLPRFAEPGYVDHF